MVFNFSQHAFVQDHALSLSELIPDFIFIYENINHNCAMLDLEMNLSRVLSYHSKALKWFELDQV